MPYKYIDSLIIPINNTEKINMQDPANRMQYLQYPSTIGQNVNHWISFSARDFKTHNNTLDIALYIPGDALSTSYKSDYESVGMGKIAGSSGAQVIDAVKNQSGGFNLKKLTSDLKGLGTALKSEGTTVAMLEVAKKADITFAGTKALIEKETGAVLNPYIVAAYKGPSEMRTHDFTFQMLPQSPSESRTCVEIARTFKKAMLPSHGGGNSSDAPSMLFGYPDEFEITFTVNGKPMPKSAYNPMFNIGRSVLTSCDLDYSTESTALFFEDTQYPVSISMKLSFMELEVMHRGKIQKGL
jgi:hypothetical protein